MDTSNSSLIKCQGTTRNGSPCRRAPLSGSNYCYQHQPKLKEKHLSSHNRLNEEINELFAENADSTSETSKLHLPGGLKVDWDGIHIYGQDVTVPAVLNSMVKMAKSSVEKVASKAYYGLGKVQSFLKDLKEKPRAASPPAPENVLAKGVGIIKDAYSVIDTIRKNKILSKATWKTLSALYEGLKETYWGEIQKRLKGDYEVDEFGYDPQFSELVSPVFEFLYHKWWRVDVSGLENIPSKGRVLLVANHSGVLPWDGAMVSTALRKELSTPRLGRPLFLRWFSTLPWVSPFLQRIGCVMACPENATLLLKKDQTVIVFPEGLKGVGKLYKTRYQLQRFGRGGFVKVAIDTKSPIVPVSIVGAEETYPNLIRFDALGKIFGLPYFPITPTWPWLGPLGLIPLPSKWRIHFGNPIFTDSYSERDAKNHLLVSDLVEHIRSVMQGKIDELIQKRRGIFG